MKIFHSGSTYSGGHPENLVSPTNVMMSYWEIRKDVAKQQARFRALLAKRGGTAKKVKASRRNSD